MKKKVLISGAIPLLLAALFCLYMESRYVNIGSVDINMTAEEMVAERPDIAVSEKDLALEAYVLSLPEVQALVEQTKTENSDDLKIAEVPLEEAALLLRNFTAEGWSVGELSVSQGSIIYVGFLHENGTERLIYTFFTDPNDTMRKTIGVYQVNADGEKNIQTIYTLDGENSQKMVFRRQWFSWLKQWMEE